MSIKKAQAIVDEVYEATGVSLVSYQLSDLNFLKEKLEDFIELEIETEDLDDPEDSVSGFSLDDPESLDEDFE